jgi:hypothetical protein
MIRNSPELISSTSPINDEISRAKDFSPLRMVCVHHLWIHKKIGIFKHPKGFAKHYIWKNPTSVGAKNLSPSGVMHYSDIPIVKNGLISSEYKNKTSHPLFFPLIIYLGFALTRF